MVVSYVIGGVSDPNSGNCNISLKHIGGRVWVNYTIVFYNVMGFDSVF